ncbi:hypothetical protein JCM8097_003831 [Rhodosporidiobolus ruineniae]
MDGAGSSEQMALRERRARQSFYDPSSDEEEGDGSVSDGDPPYLSGPPPPPIAPPPALPTHSSSEQLPPTSRKASNAGSTAGSGAGGGGGSGGPKRNFDELEDIIFSNPKSFVSLASAIAESRGVQLVISDDRTHKVSSAYMHIICAYRKAGCPLILKLVKAKEGGWIIKGAKASDLDNKQRSCYRCRHPSGSRPDISGAAVEEWLNRSTSFPEPGARPKAAKPRTASTGGSGTGVGWGGAADDDRDDDYVDSLAGKAPRASLGGRMGSVVKPEPSVAPTPTEPDRALAPPFQRSIDLQAQIVPALGGGGRPSPGGAAGGAAASVTYPPGAGGRPHPAAAYYPPNGALYHSPSAHPRGPSPPLHQRGYSSSFAPYDGPLTASPYSLPSHSRYSSHQSHPPYPTAPASTAAPAASTPPPPAPAGAYAPVVAHADPTALPEWTAVLSQLGDPSLLPLAKVLGSPFVACTPTEFFSPSSAASGPSTLKALQLALLDKLPESSTGLWPKLKLVQRAKEGELQKAWDRLVEQRKKEGEPTYVSGVRRNTLPAEIAPQGGAAAVKVNGVGGGGAAAGRSPSTGRPAFASAAAATAMEVDPSPSVASSPAASGAVNPPPPPGAAAGLNGA